MARRPGLVEGRDHDAGGDQAVDVMVVRVVQDDRAVLAVGGTHYRSKSKAFRSVVNNMLLKDKRFKKVARGQFTLKEQR